MTNLLYCRIEVAPKSIPLSNTGDVLLYVVKEGEDKGVELPVGAAVTITPGVYQVFANDTPIAKIIYEPCKFVVTPEKEVKGAQFGVYVNLLNIC